MSPSLSLSLSLLLCSGQKRNVSFKGHTGGIGLLGKESGHGSFRISSTGDVERDSLWKNGAFKRAGGTLGHSVAGNTEMLVGGRPCTDSS